MVTSAAGMLTETIPMIQQFFHEFVLGAQVLSHARKIMAAGGRDFEQAIYQAQDFVGKGQAIKREYDSLKKVTDGIDALNEKIAGAKTKAQAEALIPVLGNLVEAYKKFPDATGVRDDLRASTTALEQQIGKQGTRQIRRKNLRQIS